MRIFTKSTIAQIPKPAKVMMNRIFHPAGFLAYHLCTANGHARKNHSNNSMMSWLLSEAVATAGLSASSGERAIFAPVISCTWILVASCVTISCFSTFFLFTGNDAMAAELNKRQHRENKKSVFFICLSLWCKLFIA